MNKTVRRLELRQGYNAWAPTYDSTENPLVGLDDRHTLGVLAPKRGERILDSGCGTGRHFGAMLHARAEPCGVDLADGMLRVAQHKYPAVPMVQADLQEPFPFHHAGFDAVLCSLVGEHIERLHLTFSEMHAALRPGGRVVFSVMHPDMIAAGKEARFEHGGEDLRLGAVGHSLDDYLNFMDDVGFARIRQNVHRGDAALAAAIPAAEKYIDQPLLLVLEGTRN